MRRLSLSQLLMTSMALSTLLLMATIFVSLALFTNDLNEQARGYAVDTVTSSATLLQAEIDSVLNGAARIASQQDIIAFPQKNAEARHDAKETCQSLLNVFSNSRDMIVRSFLYTLDGSTLYSYPENIDALSYHTYNTYRDVITEYRLKSAFRASIVSRCYPCGEKWYFALIIPIYPAIAAPRENDYLGALVVICDAGTLKAKLPSVSGQIMLLTEQKNVIAASDDGWTTAWTREKGDTLTENKQRYELIEHNIAALPWSLWIAYTNENANSEIRDMRFLAWMLTAVFLVLQSVFMLILYKSIVWPVANITRQTDDVSLYAGDLRNPSAARNELTRLTGGINNMVRRVGQLNREKAEAEIKYYRERTMFLQTQINPHFLYNNLECIRGMAADGEPDEVRAMASSMAAIYRYCAKEGSIVPLQEDLACLRQYERIIALRYGDVYTLTIDAQEDTRDCAVPRMLLQPLVENSIRHGFVRAQRKRGQIWIFARVNADRLTLTVEDDGAGMTEEEKLRWNAPVTTEASAYPDEKTHIGIGNVRSRLQLMFHGDCRMRFSDSTRGGLRIDMDFEMKKL